MPISRDPRSVALENAAFLRALRRTGNAHEAARAVGASRSRFTKRRAKDPAFAARWDAALAWAQASLSSPERGGGPAKPVEGSPPKRSPTREPHLVRLKNGTVQLRVRPTAAIAPADETRFLMALSATANVRLSAKAAGFAPASLYARKRRNPGFAREWARALELGYQQLLAALYQGWGDDAHEHDAWAHNAPPPIPPMSPAQALQLLYLHQKEARLQAEPAHIKRRRGESHEAHCARLGAMYEARQERAREEFRAAEAERRARGEGPYWGGEWGDEPAACPHEVPVRLPDLAQVTGWSKAKPTEAGDEGKPALFGGWRIEDMRRKMGEG